MRINLNDLRRIVREESKKCIKKASSKSPLLKVNVKQMPWEDGKKRGVVKQKHAVQKESVLSNITDTLNEGYWGWDQPEGDPEESGDVSTKIRFEEYYIYSENESQETIVKFIDVDAEGRYNYTGFDQDSVMMDVITATLSPGSYEIIKDESGRWAAGQRVDAEELRSFVDPDLLNKNLGFYKEIQDALKNEVDVPMSYEPY